MTNKQFDAECRSGWQLARLRVSITELAMKRYGMDRAHAERLMRRYLDIFPPTED